MVKPGFHELYFGKSDSKNEVNQDKGAFLRSYVDLKNATAEVINGEKFLVLGPKGTGKSALGWYLQASQEPGHHLVSVRDASTLPLAEVPRLQTGQQAGPERTVVAWKFILLCNYLELILSDGEAKLNDAHEVKRVAHLLRDFGFMSDASGRALTVAATTTISIPIPKLGDIYKRESKSVLNIYNLIPYLETWVCEVTSRSRHVLVVDGLDSILLNDSKYDESLSSLVQAAYQLNQKLAERAASGSVVLLMRNDIFGRIALLLPDSQKMRDDLAFDLDWRIMSGAAGVDAPLMKLVRAKAAHFLGVIDVDVLSYFPPQVRVGQTGNHRDIPTFQYLLNLTRHTPRDLLRLFEEIRKVEAAGSYQPLGDGLRQEVIREGVVQYSTKYFQGAISNEFAGFEGGPRSAEQALRALKSLDRQTFTRAEFSRALNDTEADRGIDVDRLLTFTILRGCYRELRARGEKLYAILSPEGRGGNLPSGTLSTAQRVDPRLESASVSAVVYLAREGYQG